MLTPTLIAVIGPVEAALLTTWIKHYRRLGVERFLLTFHFPEHVPDERRHELHAVCRQSGIVPAGSSSGPWHEYTNSHIRDALRHQAGRGWHLFADADEFQQYPTHLREVVAQAERSRRQVVGGLLLDRVSADGHLTDWNQGDGLDLAYPLGGHLTHRLLHGDPRKIVLARHEVSLSSGNHRAPGHQPDPDRLCAVHHFKWRTGILDDLRRRVDHFSTGLWREQSPAVRDEAGRLLAHVGRYQGRVNVADPRFAFRRVSLGLMPHSWPAEARGVHTAWQPPATSREGGQ
ncbi:glycosyltransferase family 2 protein [Streptomyces sp. NPDC088261]|uniref:glycosyltransferase family 2 protein n=1 Tax=Streptomyces sp. NPDC088261 TaxID=3365851 RepID=UPI0037F45746